MPKAKIFLSGSTGRVGQEIQAICSSQDMFEIIGVSHSKNTIPAKVDADFIVDFSLPEAFDAVLKTALESNVPLVSGTTGLSSSQFEAIETASKTIPICWASNMSLGIAFLNKLLKQYGSLEGFDFQIEEIHHRHKKDAPSGTAITLQETLKKSVNEIVPEPLSLRGGGVFGVHKVWAFSEEEVILLEHQALNRKVFAQGALRVGKWLLSNKPGLYKVEDVLK